MWGWSLRPYFGHYDIPVMNGWVPAADGLMLPQVPYTIIQTLLILEGISREICSISVIMSWHRNTFHITGPLWGESNWPFVRGIHRWPVDSPHKGPAIWNLCVYYVVSLNKLLNRRQPSCQWFEVPWSPCGITCNAKCTLLNPHSKKQPYSQQGRCHLTLGPLTFADWTRTSLWLQVYCTKWVPSHQQPLCWPGCD